MWSSMQNFRTFSEQDWLSTPESVRDAFDNPEKAYSDLQKKSEKQNAHLKANSKNSDKPPSTDNPLQKKSQDEELKKKKGKPGAKKGHRGQRQKLLNPAKIVSITPSRCICGNCSFPETEAFCTHREIELPEIEMDVTHFILRKGIYPECGEVSKGAVPHGHQTGYGPGLSALIGELAGNHGNSRSCIQEFCSSVLNFHISIGAIQKVIDRVSKAVRSHYEKIADIVRNSDVANIDETSFPKNGKPAWLWVMATSFAALFLIHTNRSKEAFEQLIPDWQGILICDGYRVYQKWVGLRQSCLAHLIRNARGLSERQDTEIAGFGKWAKAELQRLCRMANAPPSLGQWNAFYARFIRLITLYRDRDDDAGIFARHLQKEMENLWVFLHQEGVTPTNNHAERMLRFGVLWRKRSQGTASVKGQRWVERVLSLRQTCRLQGKKIFPVLVDAMNAYFKEHDPDLDRISESK